MEVQSFAESKSTLFAINSLSVGWTPPYIQVIQGTTLFILWSFLFCIQTLSLHWGLVINGWYKSYLYKQPRVVWGLNTHSLTNQFNVLRFKKSWFKRFKMQFFTICNVRVEKINIVPSHCNFYRRSSFVGQSL